MARYQSQQLTSGPTHPRSKGDIRRDTIKTASRCRHDGSRCRVGLNRANYLNFPPWCLCILVVKFLALRLP